MSEIATPHKPQVVNNAAMQNLDPEYFKIFSKLGLHIVAVSLDTRRASPVWEHPELEESLGKELEEIKAGFFDSNYWLSGGEDRIAFFHCCDLGKAMQRLKAQLGVRGLLGICKLMNCVEFNQFQVWYSPIESEIGTTSTI